MEESSGCLEKFLSQSGAVALNVLESDPSMKSQDGSVGGGIPWERIIQGVAMAVEASMIGVFRISTVSQFR